MKTQFLKSAFVVAISFGTTIFSFGQNVWDGGANVPTTTNGNVTIGTTNSASISTNPTVKLQISEDNPFIELVDNTGDTRAAMPPTGCGIRLSNPNSTFEIKTVSNSLMGQGLFLQNTSSASNQGISMYKSKIFLGSISYSGGPMQTKFGDVNITANASAHRMTIVNANWYAPVLDPNYAFGVYGNSMFDGLVKIGPTNLTTPNNYNDVAGGYRLYVGGGILTEKLKVTISSATSWADFVFDKNYKLRSLNEVEGYIKENKHLPEVPSADEVANDGINVAEMDAKLLQKIEELTLYMIEMNKKVNTVTKENEALKEELQLVKKIVVSQN